MPSNLVPFTFFPPSTSFPPTLRIQTWNLRPPFWKLLMRRVRNHFGVCFLAGIVLAWIFYFQLYPPLISPNCKLAACVATVRGMGVLVHISTAIVEEKTTYYLRDD